MLKEKWEAVKKHVSEHREAYITGGVIVIIAGITQALMRDRHADMQSVPDGPSQATVRSLNFFSGGNSIVNVNEREGRGHPGYLVQCLETGEITVSQGTMAKNYDVSPSMLSSHLNGKYDNVNGLHFRRLSPLDLIQQ